MYCLYVLKPPPAPGMPLALGLVPLLPPDTSIGVMLFPDEEAALHAATMAIPEATQKKR
jgi:hypothetical protein